MRGTFHQPRLGQFILAGIRCIHAYALLLVILCVFGADFCGRTIAAPFVAQRDAHCVAISPDGRLVAIGYSGPTNGEFPPRPHPNPRKSAVVQLYEMSSRKRLRRMETFGDLTQVRFSADGTLLAASRLFAMDDGLELNEVRVWDVMTGQTRFVFDRCHSFSFAPHGKQIVVASRKRCVRYDLETGNKQLQFPGLAAAHTLVHGVDGRNLLGIVGTESGFMIRSCSTSEPISLQESEPMPDPFYSLAVPSSAPGLATGHREGIVLLRDSISLQPVARLRTGGSGRAFPFFSPTGDLLAAADQSNSDVVIWETATGKELVRYTFQQGTFQSFGAKSAARIVRPEEDPARFVFSPDGESFIGGPYGGILRLVSNGRDVARFGE